MRAHSSNSGSGEMIVQQSQQLQVQMHRIESSVPRSNGLRRRQIVRGIGTGLKTGWGEKFARREHIGVVPAHRSVFQFLEIVSGSPGGKIGRVCESLWL